MKRQVVGWSAFLAGAALLAAGLWETPSVARARVHEPEPHATLTLPLGHHDFGTLSEDASATHEFRARNPGPASWTLKRIWEDCGCVTVVSASPAVAAGEDMLVVVRIDAQGQAPGAFVRNVFALVEPGPMLLSGSISAEIAARLQVAPSPIVIELEDGRSRFEARFAIRVPFQWRAPTVAPIGAAPDLAFVVDPPTESLLGIEFSVLVAGELPPERESGEWIPEFEVLAGGEAPRRETARTNLIVRRRSRMSVSPSMLWLNDGKLQATGELFVRAADGESPDAVTWKVDPEGAAELEYDSTRGRLAVRLSENAPQRVELTLLADGHRRIVPVIVSARKPR